MTENNLNLNFLWSFSAKIKVIKDSKLVTVGKEVIKTANTVTIPKVKRKYKNKYQSKANKKIIIYSFLELIADINDYKKNSKTMSIFKKAEVLSKLTSDASKTVDLVAGLIHINILNGILNFRF